MSKTLQIIYADYCVPCDLIEQPAIDLATKYNLSYTKIDLKTLKNVSGLKLDPDTDPPYPAFTPYFYLVDSEGNRIAEWGGVLDKIDGLETMIKENI